MNGASRSPTPVHMRNPDKPSHCINVRWAAWNGSISPTPMVSVLRPIVNETTPLSSTSVPLLVSQDCEGSCTAITEADNHSCCASPIRAAATDEAHDQHQYHGACKSHDDLADDRVADYHELNVEHASEEATQKRSQDSDDDVAEQAESVTQRNAAGKETRHKAYQAPNQN